MKAKDVILLWTPPNVGDPKYALTRGQMTLCPRQELFSDPMAPVFAHGCGAALGEFDLDEHPALDAKAALLAHFHRLTIRDGMDPARVHEVLLGIEEWQVLSVVSLKPEIAGSVH
jgi:hypothetical protein